MSDANTLTAASTESPPPPPVRRRPPARGVGAGRRSCKILFVVPAALAIVALFGYPVVKNLTMSFQEYTLRTFFTGKAPWVGLQNYADGRVSDDVFSKALANTALFTIGSIVGPVRARHAAGLVLPQELPAQRGAARAVPAAVADPVDRRQRRLAGDPRAGQRHPQRHAASGIGIIDDPIPWLTSPDVALIADHPGEHLAGHPVQPDPALQRPAGHPRGAVRGGCAGRGDRLEGVLAHHLAQPAGRGQRGADARGDLHPQGAGHHPRPDPGRSGQRHPDHRRRSPTNARSSSSSSARVRRCPTS